MNIEQTTIPTLSIIGVGQNLVYTFAANHPDAQLPVVAVQNDGVTLQRHLMERLEKEIQALYHFYREGAAAQNSSDPLLPLGNSIFRELFPPAIRLALTSCQAPDGATLLLLTTEDELPWELAHDGQQYLGMRWSITRSFFSTAEQPPRQLPEPGWQVLLIGNPTDDLPNTEQEIEEIYRRIGRYAPQADIWSFSLATKTKVCDALTARHYRLIHYSGHASFKPGDTNNSGLLLAGHEILTTQEIQTLVGGQPWVFLNACNSAQNEQANEQTVQSSGSGLAKAFMLGGAQIVLGTLWPVPDQGAAIFATAVYDELLKGTAIEQAVRTAKITTWQKRPYDPIWAAYIVYGPPSLTLVEGKAHRLYPVATVLHAQFRGVDGYLARSHPDELDKLATQTNLAITALQQQVDRYGGVGIQTDAHGLTAVFGMPDREIRQHSAAQTDDQAERALGAATAMHLALPHAFAASTDSQSIPPQVTIGIAMGSVLFNPSNGHLFGRAMEVAAWLAQQAEPGQSLAEVSVVQSTRQRFQTMAWSAPATAPLPAYLQGASAEIVIAPHNQMFERELGPLIGRKQQLQRLLQAWQETRVGQGRLVEVVGAAGIGKSHLVQEFSNLLLRQNARCVFLRCSLDEQWFDYALLVSLLRRALNLASDASPAIVQQIISEQLAQARIAERSDLEMITNLLCQLIGVKIEGAALVFKSQEKLHRDLARALMRLLVSLLTKYERIALIIEDLHYVDAASLDILRQLLEGLNRQPVFCLVTYRTQWQPQWSIQLPTQRLLLQTFSMEECVALLDYSLEHPLSLPMAKQIATRANYNPLFIVELVRMLRQNSFLTFHDEQWSLSGPLTEIGASLTMQSVMQSRINGLALGLRQILEEIAVLGSEFTWELAIGMLTQTHDESEVEDGLQELHNREFIDGYLNGNELRFVHDLMHQEILNNIEPGKRRHYHLRAAHAWQGMSADLEQVNRMANHLYQGVCETIAGQVRVLTPSEIGQTNLTQAANTLIRAGEQAQSAYINQNALDHYQRAVAVTTVLGEQGRAAELARRIGRIYMFLAKWDAALEWMNRGLQSLAIQHTNNHVVHTEGQSTAALIHIHRGSIYYYQGMYTQAAIECRQGLTLAESQKTEPVIAEGCKVLGAVLDGQGKGQEALEVYQRGLLIAEALNDRYQQAQIQDNMGTALFPQGRWDEAFEMDCRGLAFWEEVNDQGNMAIAALNAGMIYLHRGVWAEAENLFKQAQEACRAVEDYRHLALAYTNLGLLGLARGDIKQGETQLQTSLKLLADHQIQDISVETLCGLSEAALLSGDGPKAIQMASEALGGLQNNDDMPMEKSIALRKLGLAYAHIGDITQTWNYLGESLQVAEAFQIVFEIGRTSMALAQVCRQTGHTSDGIVHINRALDIFMALKANLLFDEAQQLRDNLNRSEVK